MRYVLPEREIDRTIEGWGREGEPLTTAIVRRVDTPKPVHDRAACRLPGADKVLRAGLNVGTVVRCEVCGRHWEYTHSDSCYGIHWVEVRRVPPNDQAAYEPEHWEPVRRRLGLKVRRES